MRWLYKTTSQNFDVKETRLNDHMNQMGQGGWELLSVVPPQYGGKFVFFGENLRGNIKHR
jgi:hypothetical protein